MKKTHTYDEVVAASTSFFKGDGLAGSVFAKYALQNLEGEYLELTPDQMQGRLAAELTRIEDNYAKPLTYQEIYAKLANWEHVAQGSPMSGIGNPYQIQSISNCYVIESPLDSYAGIMYTDQQQVQIMKRRGGVGHDLSNLRPKGMPTSNAAKTTDGIGLFMERFSNTTREVAQSGRRGALMMSISVHHPEVETFIKIKKDKKKVTGANITVRLTDEFMEAVISDVKYEQRFPIGLDAKRQISKDVSAKSVLRTLAEAAWDSAEPGAFFWDTVLKYSPADCYSDLGFRTISSNPCQPAWATVLTQQGIKTIGEIDVGSVIWSGTQWTTVVNKWSTGVKPINAYKTGAGTFYGTDAHRIVSNGVKIEIGQATSVDPAYGPNGIHPAPFPNAITSVEFLGEEEVFDIEVDDPAHTYWTGGLLASNCGELFLCSLDSCRLYLVNLTKFVQNRFKPNASFDFEALERSAYIAQRIMDDIVDLELECIDRILAKVESDPEPANVKQTELDLWKEIRKKAVQGRRTGLGQTGLGDTIAYLGLKYGSDEAVEFTDQVYRHLAIGSYKASIDMAQERGAFPLWELEKERNHPFLQRILAELPAEYQAKYAKYGRRNIANLTTSPAGSVSCLTQTTSGIEPTIFLSYTRRRKVAPGPGVKVDFVDEIGDSWEEHKVYHLGHKAWMEETGETDETKSPYWGTTAEEVDPMAKLKMQAAAQKWVDHAISNTINLPKTATVEDVENIYLQAWKLGCKGVTVYRAGSRSGVLVKDGDQPAVQGIVETNAPKRPNVLECDLHRSRIKGEEYLIIVGLLNGKPYEVFAGLAQNIDIGHKVNKGVLTKMANAYKLTVGDETFDDVVSQFDNPNYGSFTRTLSTALRHGVPIKYLVEQLRKDKHSDLYSFSTIMARVFAKNYIKDGSKAGKSCPECKSSNINYIQGCPTCHDCGYSKCG